MKDVTTIGGRLKEILFVKGVSAAELSRKVGIERGYMSKLLNNKIKNPHKNMTQIAKTLNVSYEWLMTGVERTGTYERDYDVEGIVNSKLQKIGFFETGMPISKFHKLIYNDESINIVSTKKLGAGNYLFQNDDDIVELFRVDNFINLAWYPHEPEKDYIPIGKVITKISKEHINDKKLKLVEG
ncbi:helix-turn-helix domain-containing protein [Vibrio coralliilyticus]|uniref:Helix-turn-helix transcriptional regulator n=1 Tax=Vibrio coralliilyticus TaxID=190893 RepID=A0AAP6ZJP8_9VIBR|nr:helix-turn-helix transcriptional regulator [Vibrio coralliilyticus]NOJ22880.1 helix-turn-helix transcriptional regulator [Vibrio coralliilyticus]